MKKRRREDRAGIGPIGGRGFSGAVGGGLARIEREERRASNALATQGRAHLGLRLSVVGTIVVGLLAMLLVRLYTVQVLQSSNYRRSAIAELHTYVYTEAPRGQILARGGQVLATDVPEEVVTVQPAIDPATGTSYIAKYPTGAANLATLLGTDVKQITAQLNSPQNVPNQPVVVAVGPGQGVTDQAVVQIQEYPGRYLGVSVSRRYVRQYPQGDLATQILGYTGSSPATVAYTAKGVPIQSPLDLAEYRAYGVEANPTFGEQGLEQQYQQYLFGTPGKQVQAIQPSGAVIGTVSTTPPVPGDTVVLNMDLGLEQALWSAINAQIPRLRLNGDNSGFGAVPAPDASAVVMNARTGAVLAVASYPSYNNNVWVGGISVAQYKALQTAYGSPLNDYAVGDPQPPGSDFKLASATAALDDGLISPYTTFDDTGTYTLGTLTLHDNVGDLPFGPIQVSKAITVSSDTFFYWVGASFWAAYANDPAHYPYGDDPIQKIAADYGFGEDPGIDLPAIDVAPGQVDSPEFRKATGGLPWQPADNMEMAFGQGETLITPLQLANAYATFVDGGVRHAPELAAEIVGPTGKVVQRFSPRVTGHVPYASSADYQALLAGFDGVTQDPTGTAYGAFRGFNFNSWNVAGKTGTATVSVNPNVQPTSWFVGFGGPRANPNDQYVVAVQVNQGGYGATASAPIARAVFDYLYAHGGSFASPKP